MLSDEQTGRQRNVAGLDEQPSSNNDSSSSSSSAVSASSAAAAVVVTAEPAPAQLLLVLPDDGAAAGAATSLVAAVSGRDEGSSNLHTNQVSNQDTASSSRSQPLSAGGHTAGGQEEQEESQRPHVESSSPSLSPSEHLNGTNADRSHLRATINASYNNDHSTARQRQDYLDGTSASSRANESAQYLSAVSSADQSKDLKLHNVYFWNLIWLILPLGAVFGNLLVIMAVCMERSLQSVTNYFIVSLAFADLFVGLIVMPFAVYVLVSIIVIIIIITITFGTVKVAAFVVIVC